MTERNAECDFERLRLLLSHELPLELEEETANHVAECANCRRKLESLAGDQDWWTRVKSCFSSNAGLLKATPSTDVSHASAPPEHIGESNALATDFAVEFLVPCERPETLGRLDDIEILEVIGSGGMGIILKGYQRELGRHVAVKVMAPHLAVSATARNRFAREARAAAAVVHPHVMAIHSVNGARQLPYFVMPYVLGESLQQRLDRQGQLATAEIVRIAMQTADGLAAAHAQGLVHRDVKPANIILEKGVERVLITDFGLARTVDDASLTRSGVIAGTPQYMAPEQAEGATLDHRADLFSLGSTLFAMCTGRPPFRAETAVAVLRRICDETPRAIREINPEIPGWLEEIFEKLHQKDPRNRFQTAAEVAELLSRHLAHLQQPTTQPKPPPLADQLQTAPRKKRPLWRRMPAVAVALLSVAVAWASIAYWGGLFPAAPSHNPLPGPLVLPKIDRRPQPGNQDDKPKEMKELPKYDPDSPNSWQMKLQGRDLSELDLRNSIDDLLYASFDDRTVWPANDKMPSTFDRQKIMELGKNPGLGVRSLHEKGITGRGVRIAIIDMPLLVDHQEYVDRLQLYEEIHIRIGAKPKMHGSAVASLAVGKTVGVAPEADLFYIGQSDSDWERGGAPTCRYRAEGIHRILEINEELPQGKKIRVISISRGWSRTDLLDNRHKVISDAVQKARDEGMLVVCTGVELVHEGCNYDAIGRSPLADPDVFESYEPALFTAESGWDGSSSDYRHTFSVPIDSRTTASPDAINEYVFDRRAGSSKAPPYIAGIYALAAQVYPAITPERFWALAARTGRTIEVEHEGERCPLGPIVDPARLIRAIVSGAPAKTIVPGVGVGDYTLGMTKDEVLRRLGTPEAVYWEDKAYVLDELPTRYRMHFGHIQFEINYNDVQKIIVPTRSFTFANGLGVGDAVESIKQTFGNGCHVDDGDLLYEDKGLQFRIDEENRTVSEIIVTRARRRQTIVPGVRIGEFELGKSKDDVLRRLGKPQLIHHWGETYTLYDLPTRYRMHFGDISFGINENGRIQRITAHSPLYTFRNGLGVGDSEDKIKQAFGSDFDEVGGSLSYDDKGVEFEINGNKRTVDEISLYRTSDGHNESDGRDPAEPIPSDRSLPEVHDGDSLKPYEGVDGIDLRACDLRSAVDILDTLTFNQETIWPVSERLPEGFDPDALLEAGKNPGLGVRALHAQGIIGAGVHVGLIDQPLRTSHPEYSDRIVSYYAADFEPGQSSAHGPAMASLLVGRQCGTAPGAKLHMVAVPSWEGDAGNYTRALDRFVAYNENAPQDKKIRVVSVSAQPSGEGSEYKNQSLWDEAVERAQVHGILVLDCTWRHGFVSLCWLGPEDREYVEACTPGFRGGAVEVDEDHIHVPAKPRTWAQTEPSGYVYDGGSRGNRRPKAKNGYSPAIPYAAGILAMGWQIRPDLTPAQMKEMLFASAHVHKSGAKIINPPAFIDLIRKQGDNQLPLVHPQTISDARTIVPEGQIGGFTLGMSKGEVLSRLGEPRSIDNRDEENTPDDLPTHYRMRYDGVSFEIADNAVQEIEARSPSYRLASGVGVDDPENEVKQILGGDFHLREEKGRVSLKYEGRGISFTIDQKKRTVNEIHVYATRPMVYDRDFKAYMDARDKDLRACDLRSTADLLDTLIFTQETLWPPSERLPEGFDPQILLQEGTNPGLGVRALHALGITGAGVHVGMIDQPLFLHHPEYADRIESYHYDANCYPSISSLHGPAMASLLVGKRCGTAPGVSLHVVAIPTWKHDVGYYARALDRFVAYNKDVPTKEKIRVVSVSAGPTGPPWDKAVEQAQAQGILVLDGTHGPVSLCWLDPKDREGVESCTPGFRNGPAEVDEGHIHVPSAPRTSAEAGHDGTLGYLYIGGGRRKSPGHKGGYSACFPYAAGILALGWQIRPELTPAQIMEMLFASAHVHESAAKIINPTAFIDLVRAQRRNQG